MASCAAAMKERGYHVSGSDENVYPPMSTFLAEQGIDIHHGYDPAHLTEAPDWVVIGNAISRGNVEVEHVLNQRWTYGSLPELLREVFIRGRRSIVVTIRMASRRPPPRLPGYWILPGGIHRSHRRSSW